MASEILEKPQSQKTPAKQPLPKQVVESLGYQEGLRDIENRKRARELLVSSVPLASSQTGGRDAFFTFLDSHSKEGSPFCSLVPSIPKEELASYFHPVK